MAGMLIYYESNDKFYSFFTSNDEIYKFIKRDLYNHKCIFLWEKTDTTLEKIENARKTSDKIVEKLNISRMANLETLDLFFK